MDNRFSAFGKGGLFTAAAYLAACLHGTAPAARAQLAAHWRFNETPHVFLADHSGKENHGITGYTTAAPALFGRGWVFDGVRSFVEAPDIDDDLDVTSFTIDLWVKVDAIGSPQKLVVKGGNGEDSFVNDNYSLEVIGDGRLACGFESTSGSDESVLSVRPITTGRFVHLACTFDAATGNMTVYEDGVAFGAAAAGNPTPQQQDQAVYLGTNRRINNQPLKGVLDEVRIWSVALSAAQIASAFDEGRHRR